MKVTICIGSSCHLKGSEEVIKRIQNLITENNLSEKVEICGAFCMQNCVNGVSVTVDGTVYSVKPDTVEKFFKEEILAKL